MQACASAYYYFTLVGNRPDSGRFRRLFFSFLELWSLHFRLWGERVNSSEQHDAQEFFSCFVDTVDEAMKLCGVQKTIENIMGGVFEDQKICIDCPHR